MASNPSTPSSQTAGVTEALKNVSALGSEFLGSGSEEARTKLIAQAKELVAAAENPVETLLWNIWALPTRVVAARVAVDLKLFETALQDNSRPKTNEDFAATTNASPALVKRITRACVSMKFLNEQGPGLYIPNDLTRLLAAPEYAGGIIHCFDITAPSFAKMPDYLRETNFQNPEDAQDGPFQYANKCGSAFKWLLERPLNFEAFHGYVHALRIHRPSWTDMYPVQDCLVDGLRGAEDGGDASVLVDVGGGTGQILQDFQADVPQYKGRLVLQEVPEVINAATNMGVANSGIELQVHDFFTLQPIKGARAYFIRSCLHDWPDEQCRVILGHLKDAMEPGYSKILISDCAVADEGAVWQHVALDLFMMAQLSAQERTVSEWHTLVKSCGLRISGLYNKGEGNEALIEVVPE